VVTFFFEAAVRVATPPVAFLLELLPLLLEREVLVVFLGLFVTFLAAAAFLPDFAGEREVEAFLVLVPLLVVALVVFVTLVALVLLLLVRDLLAVALGILNY
jgi:hypothetical protein